MIPRRFPWRASPPSYSDGVVALDAGECDLGHPAIDETVDDMVIYVAVKAIDGESNTLTAAAPCIVRESNTLTSFGTIEIDEADVQLMIDEGSLASTILHEMGHVLGIGSLWTDFGFLQGAGGADPS